MTQYEIHPQAGYMVVEPLSQEELNKSELATVADEKERVSTGKVIAVSEFAGTYENFGFQFPTEVKKGDIIAYMQYSEHPVKVNGSEYHIVRFDKVTATITEKK